MKKYKASEIKAYLNKKGIVFVHRYISSKKLYQWVINNKKNEYIYPFSGRLVKEPELDDMEFSENFLKVVFSKIMNLSEYNKIKISVEEI